MAANDAIQRAQFYGDVAERTLSQGGDTVHVETGHRPDSGYMVSDADRESRVQAAGYGAEKVRRYVERHKEVLSQPDAYLGTWRASRENAEGVSRPLPTDTVYTDTSRRYPSAEAALPAMEEHNQLATYAIHTGREFSLDALRGALAETEPTHPAEALRTTEPQRDQRDRIRSEVEFRAQRDLARRRPDDDEPTGH